MWIHSMVVWFQFDQIMIGWGQDRVSDEIFALEYTEKKVLKSLRKLFGKKSFNSSVSIFMKFEFKFEKSLPSKLGLATIKGGLINIR